MSNQRWTRYVSARRLVALVASGGILAGGLAAAAPATAAATPVTVIVQGTSVPIVQTLVGVAGGRTLTTLPLVNGVLAQVPSSNTLNLLQTLGLVTSPDAPVAVDGLVGALPATAPAANSYRSASGASALADTGVTGTGVGVAVLDTGVSALPDFGNRLVSGADFSGEGSPLQDGYGHGTFVAGLIAGDGSSSGGAYAGEATGAKVVSVKVAGTTGLTDVARVIQGVAWAIANRTTYGIKVLNMSLGEVPTGPTQLNPLDQAVEAAWNAGLTVVTSAGNSGPAAGTITAPGDDPDVITVGALNDGATASPADDSIPSFSSAGPTAANAWLKPDLVASGQSVVSLKAPGSFIAQSFPGAAVGSSNFVGSGTSFSAAIVSGAAALIAQENPNAAPDEIKARMLATVTPGPTGDATKEGHGVLDVYDAANCAPVSLDQRWASVAIPLVPGVSIPLLSTWTASSWNAANYSTDVTASSWNASSWNASSWNASSWNASSWNASSWNASSWNASSWNASSWNASSWNASSWNASSWNASSWNASSWNASSWN
ncbi:MAG TPA: S8 family serine peptidase [Mycobacteriales bacterium]|nr:S8 family serine peptidase [Mycobacteriales bacterium]